MENVFMIPWWLLLIALAAGGAITSFIEYKLKYNLTDEEIDLVKSIYSKATTFERSVLGKITAIRKAL
jgi:hypothetical protein